MFTSPSHRVKRADGCRIGFRRGRAATARAIRTEQAVERGLYTVGLRLSRAGRGIDSSAVVISQVSNALGADAGSSQLTLGKGRVRHGGLLVWLT